MALARRISAAATAIWLALVPAAVLAYAVKLVLSFGPSGANSPDPSYYYLMNALNLLEGHRIEHIHHPGTPVQAIGAATIAAVHALTGSADAVRDVVERPAAYVTAYYLVLMVLYACALTALGVVAWRQTGRVGAAVAIQAVPHLIGNDARLEAVNCECVLVSVVAVLLALLLRERDAEPRFASRPVVLGAVIGFGMAVKITFAPLALIPLLMLRRVDEIARFAVAGVVSFLLSTAPIWPEYPRLFEWVVGLATHQDRYGHGPQGLAPLSTWIANSRVIVAGDPALCALLLAAALILLARLVRHLRRASAWSNSDRLMAGIVLAAFAQFIVTAKQPAHHYLLPARGTAGLLLWLVLERLPAVTRGTTDALLRLSGVAAAAWMISIGRPFEPSADAAVQARLDESYRSWAKVYYAGSSSVPYALHVGHWICGRHYTATLAQRYPGTYHYHGWGGTLSDWGGNEIDLDTLRRRHGGVVFVGGRLVHTAAGRLRLAGGDGSWTAPPAQLTETFRAEGEAIYESPGN
jgi:hypothetical protein